MRDVGKNIRWARERKNYTQAELAGLLFVTRQTVSNYETGRSRPDVETLTRLSELLDVEVTDLIYGPEPVQSRTSLGVRLGISGALIALYLLLLPLANRYANRYYNMIPTGILTFILLPAIAFSLGQLSFDALKRVWKPKPISWVKQLRILCVAWISLLSICVILVISQIFFGNWISAHWLQNLIMSVLGIRMGIPILRYAYLIATFLSGAGLVMAEGHTTK